MTDWTAYGWTLKTTPEDYLKRWPDGGNADAARAALKQAQDDVARAVDAIEEETKEDELSTEVDDTLALIQSIQVTDDESLQLAGTYRVMARELSRQIEAKHRPNIKRWNDGHKAALAEMREELAPLTSGVELLDRAMRLYRQQRQQRQLEAERKRQEEEAQRRAEEEPDEVVPFTEERELAEMGVAPEVIEPPKVDGLKVRTYWKWRLVDPEQLPREFLIPDTQKIDQVVRALKQDAAKTITGIEVYSEEGFAS